MHYTTRPWEAPVAGRAVLGAGPWAWGSAAAHRRRARARAPRRCRRSSRRMPHRPGVEAAFGRRAPAAQGKKGPGQGNGEGQNSGPAPPPGPLGAGIAGRGRRGGLAAGHVRRGRVRAGASMGGCRPRWGRRRRAQEMARGRRAGRRGHRGRRPLVGGVWVCGCAGCRVWVGFFGWRPGIGLGGLRGMARGVEVNALVVCARRAWGVQRSQPPPRRRLAAALNSCCKAAWRQSRPTPRCAAARERACTPNGPRPCARREGGGSRRDESQPRRGKRGAALHSASPPAGTGARGRAQGLPPPQPWPAHQAEPKGEARQPREAGSSGAW
jgi:hypothetical protein